MKIKNNESTTTLEGFLKFLASKSFEKHWFVY